MRRAILCFCLFATPLISCTSSDESKSVDVKKKDTLVQPSSDIASKLPPLPNGEIEGQIDVSAELASKAKEGDPIFLIARNAATGGTIAVARLIVPKKFPIPFKLTGANVMIPGRSLAGKVRVLARLDKDGEAMTKKPGDLVGEVEHLVEVPAKGVVLTLDTLLK